MNTLSGRSGRKRPLPDDFEIPDPVRRNGFTWPPVLFDDISVRLKEGLFEQLTTLFLRATVQNFNSRNDIPDLEWQPHRFLGAGGFGTAALWVRKDGIGQILDELVLKEDRNVATSDKHAGFKAGCLDVPDPFISLEAMSQMLLNESQNESRLI